ncbi:uncharacterized protein [Apostichopus japonicus]|uniref:uncharacterized protein isoform X2 n=1 Tax=Stichopus japonicus TaxID=307972 RepID=UPI003AB69AB7
METLFKVCLTVLTICNSFGTERGIVGADRRSSDFAYFVFQQPEYPRDCREVSNACSSTHNTSGVYLIKPDGYPEPFEAYCYNDLDTGGWTVLQRRRSDSVNFNRNWKDFRNGFGFLGSEFWIGNEKIAFLTNQKRYQLRMEFENVAGDTYYVTYDEFRISDEWGDYHISSLGTFKISDGIIPEWCPANEIFSNETCERNCDDPDSCISATSHSETEQCVCVGDYLIQQERCIPLNQCNCFVADKGGVLRDDEFYVNSRCTLRSTCENNQIIEASYQCSDHATCDERNGVRKCYCNQNYQGDGVTCTHNCFVAAKGSVLREGESYINSDCSLRITCNSNLLTSERYSCSADATCEERNDIRRCYCIEWFAGDGVTCTRGGPRDCSDLYRAGRRNNGKYTIYPAGSSGFEVYCEMSSGGWTILQRRTSNSVSFYRNWNEYKNGFGIPTGDHWIGNDKIYKLTNQKTYQLKIEKTNREGARYHTRYSSFRISNEGDKYRLSLSGYNGNAGNNAMVANSGYRFSTRDRDNDGSSTFDCAEKHRGGWWYPDDSNTGSTSNCYSFSNRVATGGHAYSDCICYDYYYYYCYYYYCPSSRPHLKCYNCESCTGYYYYYCNYYYYKRICCANKNPAYETTFYSCGYSNLNGEYSSNDYRGIFWKNLHGSDCGITTTTMKIRSVQ